MSDHFHTPGQIAEQLSVNPETVLRWIRRGQLGAINIASGRRTLPLYRVPAGELDRFIESRRVR